MTGPYLISGRELNHACADLIHALPPSDQKHALRCCTAAELVVTQIVWYQTT